MKLSPSLSLYSHDNYFSINCNWQVTIQEHAYKSHHETIVADFNRYMATARLVIILMDDTFKHMCILHQHDVICISHPIHWHLLSNLSPFIYQSKRKGSSKGWKDSQWCIGINLNWNNRSVLVCQCSILWEKTGPILLSLVVLWVSKFVKLYRLNYSGFCFIKYYYNVTTVLELYFHRLLASKACLRCVMKFKIFSRHCFHVNPY